MSPSFLVKILCYIYRSFIIKLASSAYICAGRLKDQTDQAASSTDI